MHAEGDRPYCPCPRGNGGERFCFELRQHFGKVQISKDLTVFLFWQRQNYRQQALCLRINPHFSVEQNCERHKIYGAWGGKRLHINEQTSWMLFVTFANFFCHFSCWWCGWWWMALTTIEKFWPLSPTVGEEVEIMTVDWGPLPNFFYLKTVIKLHWQNWPKTKHFPYLWLPAAEGDQAFLRHLSRLKTEPAATQMSFSPKLEKKNSFRCVDISSYRERVMVMALYGRMHFAQHICCIHKHFYSSIWLKFDTQTCTTSLCGRKWL